MYIGLSRLYFELHQYQTRSVYVQLSMFITILNLVCQISEFIFVSALNPKLALRKQAYSNILKILPPKNENF